MTLIREQMTIEKAAEPAGLPEPKVIESVVRETETPPGDASALEVSDIAAMLPQVRPFA
jgi:hypothetical protein